MTQTIHKERFNLIECSQWIETNGYTSVCIYLLPRFYCLASDISTCLKKTCPQVDFLVMISGSTGVDMVKYRVRNEKFSPDAVIYFGASCLCPSNYSTTLPILFVPLQSEDNEFQFVCNHLVQLKKESPNKILLISDLTNSWFLQKQQLPYLPLDSNSTDVARYIEPKASNLHFTESTSSLFENETDQANCCYPPYFIPKQLAQYDLVIFLGDCNNLEFVLNCRKLVVIDPQSRRTQTLDGPREFRKRVSLIEKFKSQSVNLFGVVFLNCTQSATPMMNSTKSFCKKLKKIPYFLTLNQTDYEMRLGNFGQLQSFVFINSCNCNMDVAINTSKYLYPIIFWKEFLIVCSQKIMYGGIEWNQDIAECQENEYEAENNEEENMKLVERDLFKAPQGWFGLVVDAGSKEIGDIKEGLRGIPSSYVNEQELF